MAMSCGVGHRCGSHPPRLWLWQATTALTAPRAWEPPYAVGLALKKPKTKQKKKEEEEEEKESNPNLKAGLSMYSAGIARMLHPKGVETNTWAGSKAKPFRLPIGFVKSFIIPRS